MRKFTKEISMLIAAVTAGTMSGTAVNAVTEADVAEMENNTYEIQRTAGVAQMEDPEEMQPTAGVPLLPDDCLDDGCEEILPTIGEEALPDYTEPEGNPIQMQGQATMPDYTEPEGQPESMMGDVAVPDYTKPETDNIPSPGVALLPDVTTEPEVTLSPDYTTAKVETILVHMAGTGGSPDEEDEAEVTEPDVTLPPPDYTKPESKIAATPGMMLPPDYTEPEESLPPEDGVAMMPDYTEPEEPWDEPMMGIMPPMITGDANEDGKFDLTDLSTTALHLIGDLEMSYSGKENADMDKDGDVDLADLATMKQVLAKQDTKTN